MQNKVSADNASNHVDRRNFSSIPQSIPIEHQIVLCEQIAALVQSGLPIERGLQLLTEQFPKQIAQSASKVSSKLESGLSLSMAIAADPRPSSRSLSATFQAGLEGNCLPQSLQSWMLVHTNQGRSISRLRISLIYPIVLTFVAASSIGFTIHHSIPLYSTMLESARLPIPKWFNILLMIHGTLWIWILFFVSVALFLTFIYYRQHSNLSSNGVPLSRSYRLRLQSHANKIIAWLLNANRPFETSQQFGIDSTGAIIKNTCPIDANVGESRNWHPISKESRAILNATASGDLNVRDAYHALIDLADLMDRQADIQLDRQLRWFPIVSSVAIGSVAFTAYILVVYLPWVQLLVKMSLPSTR